jgi:hypothetical protein
MALISSYIIHFLEFSWKIQRTAGCAPRIVWAEEQSFLYKIATAYKILHETHFVPTVEVHVRDKIRPHVAVAGQFHRPCEVPGGIVIIECRDAFGDEAGSGRGDRTVSGDLFRETLLPKRSTRVSRDAPENDAWS